MTDTFHQTVEVAVPIPVRGTFTYSVPRRFSPAAVPCKRVLVPFGNRRITGYILDQGGVEDKKEIKPILGVLDDNPLFPASMIPFFRWTADYYKHPLGEVIQTALPAGLTVFEAVTLRITDQGLYQLSHGGLADNERQVLQYLRRKSLQVSEVSRRFAPEDPRPLLSALEHRGLLESHAQVRGGAARPLHERWVRVLDETAGRARLSAKKSAIIEALRCAGKLPVRELCARIPNAATHLNSLAKAGCIKIFNRRVYRDPFGEPVSPDTALVLTVDQKRAVQALCESMGKGFRTFLLNGVTGSGKTEVYLQVASEALGRGHSVLVLVPEISLISQTERRFRARFGEQIAVLHSGLSEGERLDQWSRILRREAGIAIGVRSAIFAPFSDLGVIIVDEEHDASYKQEGGLHYSARDLAVVRARQFRAVALLGSGTPSLQSFHNVRKGKYTELCMPTRIEGRSLPDIRVVDLRKNRDMRGLQRFISPELHRAIAQSLDRGEQALLFLNRRGFASFPVCAVCGGSLRCRHCDISLTLHQAANAYRCHYCGFSLPVATGCHACGSDKIMPLGIGTEKVEAAVRALFPKARIARMDRDTTRRKGSLISLLKGLREKTIDVMVGTQMLAKGHDFPDVTLVGIICADLSLSLPDFRAGERTFQLLAQVAGRAGRGDRPGRVILQTFNPDNFHIRAACSQDFKAFYDTEISFRKELRYPPVARMIQLRISGRDVKRTRKAAERLGEACWHIKKTKPVDFVSIDILGPVEAALARIARHYRWQILLKSLDGRALHRFAEGLIAEQPKLFSSRSARVVMDVDPVSML